MTANILETKAAKTSYKHVKKTNNICWNNKGEALWNFNHIISQLTKQPKKTARTDEIAGEWPAWAALLP